MAIRKGEGVKVQYSYIDGMHFFVSPDVKGLCAASKDLRAAYNAVSIQLSDIVSEARGEPCYFQPAVPVEKFEQWLHAICREPVPELTSGAFAQWALTNKAQRTTM